MIAEGTDNNSTCLLLSCVKHFAIRVRWNCLGGKRGGKYFYVTGSLDGKRPKGLVALVVERLDTQLVRVGHVVVLMKR